MNDPDPDPIEALKRAGSRAAYHLLRAGIEGLKAVEAVVDELGKLARREQPEPPRRTHIELE